MEDKLTGQSYINIPHLLALVLLQHASNHYSVCKFGFNLSMGNLRLMGTVLTYMSTLWYYETVQSICIVLKALHLIKIIKGAQ